ncbi:MAG TPA: cytochrome c, partial [Solirubrobacteraceae bacterium]|nr:cytochrome c [Solirubrobacteraceae bacterium]
RPEPGPIAPTAGILTTIAMGYLPYPGASAGPPAELDIPVPANVTQQGPKAVATFKAGQQVVAQSGCGACHKFGENGNDGPGPELSEIGARLPGQAISRTLINPPSPMPSFKGLQQSNPQQFDEMVLFLSELK